MSNNFVCLFVYLVQLVLVLQSEGSLVDTRNTNLRYCFFFSACVCILDTYITDNMTTLPPLIKFPSYALARAPYPTYQQQPT